MTRGLSEKLEHKLLVLVEFLRAYGIDDVDLEPWADRGYQLQARDNRGRLKFSAWGASINDAIDNLVKSVVH